MKSYCIVSVYFARVIKNSAFVSIFGANLIMSQYKLYYYQVAWMSTSSFNGGGGIFLQDFILIPPSRFKKVFWWIIIEKGLGFFCILLKNLEKQRTFPPWIIKNTLPIPRAVSRISLWRKGVQNG
jgi:hypothetical protein